MKLTVIGVHGGILAALLQLAAKKHFTTTLSSQNQPDILSVHFEFLRMCTHDSFIITITDLKIGRGYSTIQMYLTQPNSAPSQPKIAATATSINFDTSHGPAATADWKLQPQPRPSPDWSRIETNQRDENWLPVIVEGEVMPFTRRMMQLNPRGGFPVNGICDSWSSFGSERIDSTYLTVLTDIIPSMSDTLLRTDGMFDAHAIGRATETWANTNPGIPARLSNSLLQAQMAKIRNSTLTLDIEFKNRLPRNGLDWAFSRVSTKELSDGRMNVEVTISDSSMQSFCVARHLVLVLDARRTFDERKQTRERSVL